MKLITFYSGLIPADDHSFFRTLTYCWNWNLLSYPEVFGSVIVIINLNLNINYYYDYWEIMYTLVNKNIVDANGDS